VRLGGQVTLPKPTVLELSEFILRGKTMSAFKLVFMLTVTVVLTVHSTLAASFAVGTCKPTLPSFANISTAVSSVPPSSTVLVCPGTYKEQVTISQPLTLQGITSANSAQAVIAVPTGGLSTTSDLVFGFTAAPQVMVTAGPVTLTNITVDGTGGGVGCTVFLVGIYYAGGSSGTVNEITTRNHLNSTCSIGILADNETSTSESVTIQNSSIHDVEGFGVVEGTSQTPPTLTATVKGNTIDSSNTGIQTFLNAGSVTGNVVSAGFTALNLAAPATTVSGNTITNSGAGIVADSEGVSATSNRISNSQIGIAIAANGTNFQSNTVTKTTTGIDLGCHTATVAHNTISDATVGLADVPASFASSNKFYNVNTIRTDGCAAGQTHSAVQAAQLPVQAMPR
jgi:hypothetical protein